KITHRVSYIMFRGITLVILNLLLTALTFISFRNTKAIRKKTNLKTSNKYDNIKLAAYMRLGLITGFVQMFYYFGRKTNEKIIGDITLLLSTLQGMYLFVAFTANKATFDYVKNAWKQKTNSISKIKLPSTVSMSFDIKN
ncbi:G protein-coupled receptor family protein, partial [Wolbachia endosymbiont of Pentidionis agamae]|uniref:hypothetical protein n=1 Tax=Wolbachia endosymbiont of Pentidionis agamae TaxID=3110435 RepID=UPI002FD1E833